MTNKCREFFTSTKYDVHCSNATIVFIVLGVCLTTVAFLYPVDWDYKLDPNLSAVVNEDRRLAQVRTQNMVYIMSVTGMILVTIGGIISSFLLTKYILLDECVKTDDDDMLIQTQKPPPPTTVTDSQDTGNAPDQTIHTGEGQRCKLVESDHLQWNGASPQYGSTK